MSSSNALDPLNLTLLNDGDIIGDHIPLMGHPLLPVHLPSSPPTSPPTFQVVRKLGTGSYAVVYLVREILSHPPKNIILSDDSIFDLDYLSPSDSPPPPPTYGREFALKCLSKANLDHDALSAQLVEATVHQSLPIHPNIVTLHRTLESPSFLLLVLEFVPGQDLFYFLEQARDHYQVPTPSPPPIDAQPLSGTPTTPSLLSALHPSALLSHTRLRLIASMFSQMCEAVAVCHARGVYHRDIKPENFIVTDGWVAGERKVVVKLTDFGLATLDEESSDMDCGSAPYMSFECRNNLAPTYSPRHADVWSLGIVLINMLYHHNPWTDTSLQEENICPSFEAFRTLATDPNGRPEEFFLKRFVGMSEKVATFLARRVFCFIGTSSGRISAEEFGQWARNLPELFGRGADTRLLGSGSVKPLEIAPKSRRPSLRSGGFPSRTPIVAGSTANNGLLISGTSYTLYDTRGRTPELIRDIDDSETSIETNTSGASALSSPLVVGGMILPPMPDPEIDAEQEQAEEEECDGTGSRAASTTRRRKRGARKKNGNGNVSAIAGGASTQSFASTQTSVNSPLQDEEDMGDHLDDMAVRSQLLARELSKARSWLTGGSGGDQPVPPLPHVEVAPSEEAAEEVKEKKRKWKGMFRMASTEALSHSPSVSVVPPTTTQGPHPHPYTSPHSKSSAALSISSTGTTTSQRSKSKSRSSTAAMTGTAANVSNLVMGLNPHALSSHLNLSTNGSPAPSIHTHPASSSASLEKDIEPRRGRKDKSYRPIGPVFSHVQMIPPTNWGPQPRIEFVPMPPPRVTKVQERERDRAQSPNASTRSPNWRNSMSGDSNFTASTSTSAFTRYSNSSVRSLDTVATSISGSSSNWRSGSQTDVVKPSAKGKHVGNAPVTTPTTPDSPTSSSPPVNVKMMTGVPWELTLLPRQCHPRPEGDIFGAPPIRKNNKHSKGRNPAPLDTINERPQVSPSSPPPHPPISWRNMASQAMMTPTNANASLKSISQRCDASTSTTDLTDRARGGGGNGDVAESSSANDSRPQKVQKGQINALAKMLSALRR